MSTGEILGWGDASRDRASRQPRPVPAAGLLARGGVAAGLGRLDGRRRAAGRRGRAGRPGRSDAAGGASPSDVVRTTVYVVTSERADLGVVWDAVQASGFARAASTLLGVGLLGYEGQLVEIEATAVVGA